MNLCPNCGKPVEGKFCSYCGAKIGAEKSCPNCQTTLAENAKFCYECGYSFVGGSKAKNQRNILLIFRLIPFLLCALFSGLLFAFYAAPVAELVWGMGLPNQTLGNIYTMRSGLLNEIPEIESALILLIAFAIVNVLYAVAMGVACFVSKLKHHEIILFRRKISLNLLLHYISLVFYAITIFFGVAIIVVINKADDGMGLFTAGSCPILLLIFGSVFLLLSGSVIVIKKMLWQKNPDLATLEQEEKEFYFASEEKRKEQFYATHSAPYPPEEGLARKIDFFTYKHAQRKYKKASDTPTPRWLVFLDCYKPFFASAAILVVALLILIPILTSKFRISVVEKINLGDSPQQVEAILGAPCAEASTESSWKYHGEKYLSVIKKIEQNAEAQEAALESNNEKKLLNLITQEQALLKEKAEITDKYIEVQFEKDSTGAYTVSSVLLDKKYSENNAKNEKSLKKVSVPDTGFVEYKDIKLWIGSAKNKTSIPSYSAYYQGGAFYRAELPLASGDFNENTLQWTDQYASYTATFHFDNYPDKDNRNDITNIIILSVSTYINSEIFEGCSKLSSIQVAENNSTYHSSGNCLINTGSKTLIRGCKNSIIPADGSVTKIGNNAFTDCAGLTSITIPNSITSIGKEAFYGCIDLSIIQVAENNTIYHSSGNCLIETESKTLIRGCKNSIIPADGSVTNIGNNAFTNCLGLTSITIPDSIASIGEEAFYGCIDLSNIQVTENNSTYHSSGNCLIETESKTLILGCKSSIIPSDGSVDIIGARAFYKCSTLISIIIPDSINGIREEAFSGCSGLTNITISDNSIGQIPDRMFEGCTGLTNISIPAGLGRIGKYAFHNCNNLTSITIPDSVFIIDENAFAGCGSLTNITIPDRVTSIGEYTFYKCTGLTSVTFGENNQLTSIGKGALCGCSSLTSITIPDSVTIIGDGAFYNCSSLTSITIPDGVTSIGSEAFYDCSSLTSITIPNSVTSIGSEAFYRCTGLTSITIPNSVTSIGSDAFYNCNSLTSITIPDGVTSIGARAFSSCTSLTSITIPNSVTIIGDGAFSDCSSLTSITIPNSVTSIDGYAFYGCTGLTSITIPNAVTSIALGAFSSCTGLTSITIPDGVTEIGDSTFSDCYRLTSITIPNSVTSIGNFAFANCDDLTSITFTGTMGEWNAIEKKQAIGISTPATTPFTVVTVTLRKQTHENLIINTCPRRIFLSGAMLLCA